MKKLNIIVNWLILTVIAAIPSGIMTYALIALTHRTKVWQGYRIYYFYVTRATIVLLVLSLIVLAGIKLLITALTVKAAEPADESADHTADRSQQS